jgi:hypothetical protein
MKAFPAPPEPPRRAASRLGHQRRRHRLTRALGARAAARTSGLDVVVAAPDLDSSGVGTSVMSIRDGSRTALHPRALPCGFQNSAMVSDQGFQAAVSYSLMSPPRIGRRRILP